MTRKEFRKRFDKAKEVPWNEKIEHIRKIYILPTRRKHESGYSIMHLLFLLEDGTEIKDEGCCDLLQFEGKRVRMDCLYPSGIIKVWMDGPMVSHDRLSSVDIYTEANGRNRGMPF